MVLQVLETFRVETMNLKLSKSAPHSPEILPNKVLGYPINKQELQSLKRTVFGDENRSIPNNWKNKGFQVNRHCNFGFMQKKGGPCTVLASMNAYLFKHLLFSEFECFDVVEILNEVPSLKPSDDQLYRAFAYGLADVLWKCASNSQIVKLALFNNNSINIEKYDGISEYMEIYEFARFDLLVDMSDLVDFILLNISLFKGNTIKTSFHAVLSVIYSCVLSRGLDSVTSDLNGNGPLIDNDENAYGTQSVVNLMLTGRAIMDTLDQLDADELGLQGMTVQSDIGFLTPIEHMVGNCLQSPKFPIWILHYDSHYTVMFKCDKLSNIYTYYDMMGLRESCWKFRIINENLTLLEALNNADTNGDTVLLCCLTKWKNIRVDYIE
eukprot:NODE_45_length_27728_cov_0.328387.p5 type:complete len:381 gc:universal NODE_45_length_27728_cov_0.328387:25420-24278(-)